MHQDDYLDIRLKASSTVHQWKIVADHLDVMA
jgi:hypothetical protein